MGYIDNIIKGMKVLENKDIQERIRRFGEIAGFNSDAIICEKCGFGNRSVLGKIGDLKTAPQLDTLDKFAKGLHVAIEDLIYQRTESQRRLQELTDKMTDDERNQVIGIIMAQLWENTEQPNEKRRKVA
jgi:ribosomal protein L37E